MKTITQSNRFKKDLKLMAKRGCNLEKFKEIVVLIANDESLPGRCKPHKLLGDYKDFWECHIESDWLLIYSFGPDFLDLARTGTHADLFE